MTVRTTLGISNFSPLDNFTVLVPYATSWRNEGLDKKSMKWSTFTGFRRVLAITGGSIVCPGLFLKACFLASSILHFVRRGMNWRSSDLEKSLAISDRICCLVYQEFASSYKTIKRCTRVPSAASSIPLWSLCLSMTCSRSHDEFPGAMASSRESTACAALRL